MASIKVRKVGNSIGVILPKGVQRTLGVVEGDVLEFTRLPGKRMLVETSLGHHSHWQFPEPSRNDEDRLWLESDLDAHDESSDW